MLARLHAALLSAAFLLTIAVQKIAPAQLPPFSDAFLSDVRTTQPEKPVAVRIADPFARLDQERALLKFLSQPHTYGWDAQTTLADIGRDIGRHVTLQIDHRALEEIGLSAEELMFPESEASDRKDRLFGTPTEDPFADRATQSAATSLASQMPPKNWWDDKRATTSPGRMTNADRLFQGLGNADLVIATWSGRWLITTEEAAEENLSLRLYDVTPLADIKDVRSSPVVRNRMHPPSGAYGHGLISPYDSLMEVVQTSVDPDTWEMLGGPSTCSALTVRGRTWLVMSTRVMTHWKVQALLNQLNGS